MVTVFFVLFICSSFTLASYQLGDSIDAQFQIKTEDVVYKWEALPFSCRPHFGVLTSFTMNDIGATFFVNDDFKIRFSFQKGRFLTPYMPIHHKGTPIFSTATISFDAARSNITKMAVVPTLDTNKQLTAETFSKISFTYEFNEKTHEYANISQLVILVGTIMFTFILTGLQVARIIGLPKPTIN
ncbi:Uncharacterized protein QTN25_010135 [Entamoeba marina]